MTDAKPSKNARKREARAFKAMADELLGLSDDEVARLNLDERLSDAVDSARKMKSREALRRHKQFIARLLMNTDTAALRAVIERRDAADRRQQQHFHQAERWRDRLVRDRTASLEAFESTVGRESDELRSLLASLETARSDREEKGIRKAIFRSVYDLLGEAQAGPVADRADDR